MPEAKVEALVMSFALLLFGMGAVSPQRLFWFLGRRGKGIAPGVVTFYRVLGALGVVAMIYRLLVLYHVIGL
jgi:hypothetical protein